MMTPEECTPRICDWCGRKCDAAIAVEQREVARVVAVFCSRACQEDQDRWEERFEERLVYPTNEHDTRGER